MPIFEYVCDDCGERYERIVMNGEYEDHLPEVREREEHDPAFRFRGARQRREILGRIVSGVRFAAAVVAAVPAAATRRFGPSPFPAKILSPPFADNCETLSPGKVPRGD